MKASQNGLILEIVPRNWFKTLADEEWRWNLKINDLLDYYNDGNYWKVYQIMDVRESEEEIEGEV